jgi:hypothetical protein
MSRFRTVILSAVGVAVATAACFSGYRFLYPPEEPPTSTGTFGDHSFDRPTNGYFVEDRGGPESIPKVSAIEIPTEPGDHAIWGAIGRDSRGRIWFVTSSFKHPTLTARLYEYVPTEHTVHVRGDVLTELDKAGLLRIGEEQPKIHTKIVEAGDGHLYFASMDEPRPGEVGQRAPPWGSHLWRLRLPDRRWEHLQRFDEGLIALAGGGSYLYALAFPDHTLIQYNVATGQIRSVTVGSVEGHVSRNLFADERSHVYVPRLRYTRPNHADHTLVEFDPMLREVGENRLRDYQAGSADQSHGIVAFQHLADRSIAFTTSAGRLLRVIPNPNGPAALVDWGWVLANGRSYPPTLFTRDGSNQLYCLAFPKTTGKVAPPVWVCHQIDSGRTYDQEIILPIMSDMAPGGEWLLYGCEAIDEQGNFYIVGAYPAKGGRKPALLQVKLIP